MYWIAEDGHVWRTTLESATSRGTIDVRERVSSTPIPRREGFVYFLGKDGFVYEALGDPDLG